MNPGDLLRNRYRIEKALAAGGFGETYMAIDLDYPGQRQVVVKHLKPASNDPGTLQIARRLFEAEAQVLAELGESSDRLPALYAYFEEQGEFYLVQEFIAGVTLTAELAGRKLSEAEMIKVLQEILTGLVVVHSKNKIHRDLKPDNIIRRAKDDKLVLIDFGAVKEVRQAAGMGTNAALSASIGIGTHGYMPTEQAIGFPRLASDVYAVGAIGIQCLTGIEPHKLFDQNDLVFRWQHLCQVSTDLAAVLEKMVAPQVSDRYRDGMAAAEVIEKLSITPLSSAKVKQQPPVTTPASTLILDGSHKFLKSLMIGGAGLFGMFLLISVFSLVKTLLPKTPIINNSSTDGSSLPSSTTPSLTANNGNNDTKFRDDQKLSESELENKKKEIAGYDKTISINSQDADAYLKRGIAKFKLGNTQEAMDDFNKAISLAPKDARAYGVRGAAKFQSGNKQEAIDDFNKVISLDPKNANAYNDRGNAKFQSGNKKEAITDYDKAISLDPKYAYAYSNRGAANYDLGNKKEAITDFNKAISLDPKYAQAYGSRGFAKYSLGDLSGSLADYEKSLAIDPQLEGVHSNMAFVKYDLRDIPSAIELWRKSLKSSTDNPDAQLGLAVALYRQGQAAEAVQLAKTAISKEKRSTDLVFLRKDKAWSEIIIKDAVELFKAL